MTNGGLINCTPYKCAAGKCREVCSTNNDCNAGYTCINGATCWYK